MNIKGMLRMAAVVGVAVLAGLIGVQGTWALWSSTVQVEPQRIQAADFRVELNGSPMTVNGVAATVTLPNPSVPLTPTTPIHAAVSVRNATNAGGTFKVLAATGPAVISNATIPALTTSLTVQTAPAPASGDCAAATFGATRASVSIAKGAAAVICVRVSLPANAPETLRGATATITVPVTVSQQGA